MDSLLDFEPSPDQRMLLLGAFVFIGLVLSVQVSQTQTDTPLQWTRLTSENSHIWFTIYVLEAFLLVQNTYPMLLEMMEDFAFGHEERILNAVWVGLLGLEVLMVLGVAARGIAKRLSPAPKQKTS